MAIKKSILKAAAAQEAIDREGYKPLRAKASPKSKAWIEKYPPNQWHFELVGVVRGYPLCPEVWEQRRQLARDMTRKAIAEGKKPTRRGVPDGFKGLGQAVADARLWREIEGKRIVKIMEDRDLIEYPDISQYESVEDHEAAKGALALCVSIVRSDTYKPRERLEAARTVLTFTKAKPVQRVENTLKTAEDFLSVLAGEVVMPTE